MQPKIIGWRTYCHTALNRHISVIKIQTDTLCRLCGEEEDISYHFLWQCGATMLARNSTFRAHLIAIEAWSYER